MLQGPWVAAHPSVSVPAAAAGQLQDGVEQIMPMAQPLLLTLMVSGAPSCPQTLKTPWMVAKLISHHRPIVVSVKHLRFLCPNMGLFTQPRVLSSETTQLPSLSFPEGKGVPTLQTDR